MRTTTGLIVALLLLLPMHLSAQESGAATSAAVPTVLSPGDAIRIVVWRKPELSGEFPITANGSVGSPFYMDVNVVGIPLSEVSERVRAYIAVYEAEPRVLVEPLLRVSVGGEVRNPALYTLPPETTIAEAVMEAGGGTERGHLARVILWRGGQELTVDLTQPEHGLAGQPIRSGDQIVMPRRVSVFRDYIAPIGGLIGAAAAVTNVILRSW